MLSAKYYDSPDGHDIANKTFVLSKYAALTGLTVGTMDVLMYSHPKGVFNTAYRYGWYIGPLVGMATAFTITSNIAQHTRGKNDELNYFLGGLASGVVFGAWARSAVVGVPIAVVLGAIGVVKKTAVDHGWTLFPPPNQMAKTITSNRHDWTWAKDVEELKTWSKQ